MTETQGRHPSEGYGRIWQLPEAQVHQFPRQRNKRISLDSATNTYEQVAFELHLSFVEISFKKEIKVLLRCNAAP